MSDRVNKFCASLQGKLNDLDDRLTSFKTSLQSAPKQAEDALHKQLDQARHKVESQKQAVAKARTSVQNWMDQKKAEAEATVDGWKAGREAKNWQFADRAEEYAAAAIEVAVLTIDEAEQAVLEAIAAAIGRRRSAR